MTRFLPAGRLAPLLFPFLVCSPLFFACNQGDDSQDASNTQATVFNDPVPHPRAAADAFRLFYRERVERALLAYNRFHIFGDSVFATTIGS